MQRLTLSLLGLIASIGIVLLPILVMPFLQVTAEDQKGVLAGCIVGLVLLVGAATVYMSRNAFVTRPSAWSLVGMPLLLVAIASAVFNGAPFVAWFGEALEFGVVASYGLFALVLLFASLVHAGSGRLTLHIYVGGALLCGIVSAVASVVGGGSSILSNWPTVSAAVTLALICAAALADWSEKWSEREWILTLASGALLVCLLLFFNTVYVGVAAGVLLASVVMRATLFSIGHASRLPILSLFLVLSLVAAVTLGVRDPVLDVPPDIRPSPEATHLVSGPIFASSLSNVFIGAGPESFGKTWNRYRPQEFNQTPLWNTTFKEGNSTVSTLLVELGIFGVFAWLLPLIVAGILGVRKIRGLSETSAACFLVALGYYAASFFYTTGLVPMLLCGVLLGLFVQPLLGKSGSIWNSRLLRLAVGVLLVVPGLMFVLVSSLQLFSLHYRMIGIERFEAGEYAAAHDALSKGIEYWATPRLYANDANVLLATVRDAAASSTPSTEMIDQTTQAITQAIKMDRNDLTVALTRASIYVVLAGPLHRAEAESQAATSIEHAAILAPNRPEATYLRSVFAAQMGRVEESRTYLAKTLSLKPDYEPALKLQKQLGAQ